MPSLANPTRFLELAGRAFPWLAATTLILLAIGLYLAFFVAPPDYQQGETVRIMFVLSTSSAGIETGCWL